ncbi:MAG: hypothetical protein JWL59_4129 [Chthoniobacteraceae bacterium]|nr:hypothetical protein [Chthoniobacteraceae bacterium]
MSAWKDFVTAALIGTEKAALPQLPVPLDSALNGTVTMDREMRFLTESGAVALSRRAGWKPCLNKTEILLAEAESTGEISRASAMHLRVMLGGRHLPLLSEWLIECARLQRHVPAELLPALLDRAAQDRSLRPLALGAGGRRIHWLAAYHPGWKFAAADSPELWETGSRDQRVAILRALRASAPEEARAKIEAVWKTEPADVRTAFIAELLPNLSEEEIPFLETLLDDRSKEVRRAVIDLLARLPSSPFAMRMIGRVKPLLVYKKSGILSRASMEVTLPADPDPAGLRDGLDSKAFGQQKVLGEKAVLLVQLIASVPLDHWGDSPEALLKAAGKNEFGRALATGWTWAALRQRDAMWAEALLDAKVRPHAELIPAEPLFGLLPEPARIERLIAMLQDGALKKGDSATWHSLAGKLAAFPGHWPVRLGREVLAALRLAVHNGIPWHLRALSQSLLTGLPPALLPEAMRGWPVEKEGVGELVEMLTFRHDALLAFSPPP